MDAENHEPEASFGSLVFSRAWFRAWRFFVDVRHDLAIGVISGVNVGYQRYAQQGGSLSWAALGMDAVNFIIPFVVIWALLFIWHFWLAPAALVYERLSRVSLSAPRTGAPAAPKPPKPKGSHVNWRPWALRQKITVSELASILSKEDPSAHSLSTERAAMLDLIKEQMDSGKLPPRTPFRQDYYTRAWEKASYETELDKNVALTWAKKLNFDVSHVE